MHSYTVNDTLFFILLYNPFLNFTILNEDGQTMFGIAGGADFLLTVTIEKP